MKSNYDLCLKNEKKLGESKALKITCYFLSIVLTVLCGLTAACFIRVFVYFAPEDIPSNQPINDVIQVAPQYMYIQRLSQAIQFETVSRNRGDYNGAEMIKFAEYLKQSFPLIHSNQWVSREVVYNYSLLYTVTGANETLKPYLLMAHMDVVPVDEDKWTVPPFAGLIKDGYIYGRGAIDDKHQLMGIMEAFEYRLSQGYRPKRSFYLAFGHDEEVMGFEGGYHISQTLENRGVNDLLFILDEGSGIANGSGDGINRLIARISTTEKGYATFKLTATGPTGHSSSPPEDSATVRLGAAIASNQSEECFRFWPRKGVLRSSCSTLSFAKRFFASNLWLFSSLWAHLIGSTSAGNNMVRTSTAVTVIKAGTKDNVIPGTAEALVNHRIHPYQSVQQVLEFDRTLVEKEKIDVQIFERMASEPHPVSPHDADAEGYQLIKKTVLEMYPEALVVPNLLSGSTDTKRYLNLSKSIYRFSPVPLPAEDGKRMHGHDERIPIFVYLKTINFYHQLFINCDQTIGS